MTNSAPPSGPIDHHANEAASLIRAAWLIITSPDTDFASERDREALRSAISAAMDQADAAAHLATNKAG